MDVFYAHDINDKKHTFLSMVDFGTTFHIVAPIEPTSAAEIEKAFKDFWVTPYGPPSVLALDLETGLQSGVARLRGWHAIHIRNAATQSHWQAGLVERQGQRWKSVWTRLIHHMGRGGEVGSDDGQLCKKKPATALWSLPSCVGVWTRSSSAPRSQRSRWWRTPFFRHLHRGEVSASGRHTSQRENRFS